MSLPLVSMVVLNRNGADSVLDCLDSLFGVSYPEFRVILIDNASEDGSLEKVRAWASAASDRLGRQAGSITWEEFTVGQEGHLPADGGRTAHGLLPKLTILSSSLNLGFAGGQNLGIRLALDRGAALVLLLNSDIIVDAGFLEPLVKAALGPRTGAAGPVVLSHGQEDVVWQAGGKVYRGRGWTERCGAGQSLSRLDLKTARVDYLPGCAVLLKRDALKQVGLFDQDYFLYFEDTDLFVRMASWGWEAVLVPESRVWHKDTSLSGMAKSVYSSYYFSRNRLLLWRKHYPGRLPEAVLWSLRYGILNNLARRRWRQLRMSLAGIWDFLRGRTGSRKDLDHTVRPVPNVLVFSLDYKPQPGGIAEHAYRVAERFCDRSRSVAVLAPGLRDSEAFDKTQMFPTYRVPRLPLVDWVIYFFLALRLILRDGIGLVYCATSYPCALICSALRLLVSFRFTVTIHGHEVIYSGPGPRHRLKAALRSLQVAMLNAADRVFAVSDFSREALIAAGVKPQKVAAIYNGVDARDFEDVPSSGDIMKRLGLAGRRLLLTVSRLDVHKGHDVVIRALPAVIRQVPDLMYLIVGEGSTRRELQTLARTCGVGDHVTFAGLLPRSDVIQLYKACDLFALMSRVQDGRVEGFGLVFLEAAMFKKPVVGGRSGGVPDAVVDQRTGLLVDPSDPREVAEAITRILLDGDLAARLGAAGYERATREFTWDMTVDRILAALNRP